MIFISFAQFLFFYILFNPSSFVISLTYRKYEYMLFKFKKTIARLTIIAGVVVVSACGGSDPLDIQSSGSGSGSGAAPAGFSYDGNWSLTTQLRGIRGASNCQWLDNTFPLTISNSCSSIVFGGVTMTGGCTESGFTMTGELNPVKHTATGQPNAAGQIVGQGTTSLGEACFADYNFTAVRN
jgi:hypothetical protein